MQYIVIFLFCSAIFILERYCKYSAIWDTKTGDFQGS